MAGKGFTVKKDWDNPREHQMPAEARVPAEVRLGNVLVAPATVLAPMAGVTDTVFRRFIRHASLFTADSTTPDKGVISVNIPEEHPSGAKAHIDFAVSAARLKSCPDTNRDSSSTGSDADARHAGIGIEDAVTNAQSGCGLLMSEFTSADGLARMRETKRRRYLTFYDDEHPIGAQLFGSNAETLAEAARIVEQTGFDLVDLNLGCPAKRVVGCNGGSGLLRDLPRIGEIFRAVRKAVTIPFTVKFRMGWNEKQIVCVELARMAEAEGLNAVALHARTRDQGYSGQAQWEWIAAVKQAVGIPVIGNGDITTPEAAVAMVAETGCDAVMIGRAAPANPWIFRQIAQYTATGRYETATVEDRYRMIRAYFQMLLDEAEATKDLPRDGRMGETAGKMKQFATWFTHGVPGGAKLRAAIYHAKTGPEVLEQVELFFAARRPEDDCGLQVEECDGQGLPDGAMVCD